MANTYAYVWAIATAIFSYTGSPKVKISQKVLWGYFFDSRCSKGQFIVVKIPKRRALLVMWVGSRT